VQNVVAAAQLNQESAMSTSPPGHVGRAGRLFYVGMTTAALAIGALQMFHVRGGFVTNYGADLFGTAWFYAMFRQGRTIFQRGRPLGAAASASAVFAGCAAFELAQRIDLFPGVFDPLDLAAFAGSVLACYALDRRLNLGADVSGDRIKGSVQPG
jgi:hypothetical protein